MTNNSLGDSEGNNNRSKNQIDREKAPQLQLGIQKGVAHEEKRYVVEKQLETEETIDEVRGSGIKNLDNSEPHQEQHGHEERWPKEMNFFASIRKEKGEIDEENKNVLCEEDCHMIAQVLAGKVFKQKPCEKKIQTPSPITDNRDNEGATQNTYGHVGEASHVVSDDVGGSLISGDGKKYRKPND